MLVGKWIFLALVGFAQLTVMFTWGQLVFGLPLSRHLPGFVVMTLVHRGGRGGARAGARHAGPHARAAVGLLDDPDPDDVGARRQHVSAIPDERERCRRSASLTFNAWALDGYLKVFWRDAAIWQLWPQVAVLVALTLVFLSVARLMARRWESA